MMNTMKKKADVRKFPESKIALTTGKKFAIRALGAFILAMSVSVFAQGIPLLFVFIGAYLGVPADATINDMDTMVWVLTSVTMMIVAVYAFITWMKFVRRRFIAKPAPIFTSFKRKAKHA